jgi:pseudaminic acid synthase
MEIIIGKNKIGKDDKVFIIAELSANHGHNFETAVKAIYAAKEAGADAIKLQTYTPDTITLDCDNEFFKVNHGTIWDGTTLYKLYQSAYTPWEWQPKLKQIAEEIGLVCFSSPFDRTAVDFLEQMNVPAYKIASFEITDTPLIEYTASKGKPIIISTGIATEEDVQLAVDACRKVGNNQIALLKCTSEYPAPYEEANLKTIPYLAEKYSVVAGLSDHTMGADVSIAAVALGAKIIEKHFIVERNIGGPDASFSMEPAEFKLMVDSIRNVEKAIGVAKLELTEKVLKSRSFARSLFVVTDVKAGDSITKDNVRSIRPNAGMHPKYLKGILGDKFKYDILKGTPLTENLIEHF